MKKTVRSNVIALLIAIFTFAQPTPSLKADLLPETEPVGAIAVKTIKENTLYVIKAQWRNDIIPGGFANILFEAVLTGNDETIVEFPVVVYTSARIPKLQDGTYLMKTGGKLFFNNPALSTRVEFECISRP